MKINSFLFLQEIYPKCMLYVLTVVFSLSTYLLAGQCTPHSISTPENESRIFACAGDGKPDNYIFTKSDSSSLKYAFILSDRSDNIIRVQTLPNFNFDGTAPTLFRVWGVSYSDSITFKVGQDVTTVQGVNGCARLSENFILIVREIPSAPDAFFANGDRDTVFCASNALLDTLIMQDPQLTTGKQIFIVTKFGGAIVDFFTGLLFVVDGLPKGSYFIYVVSYTGNLTIAPNNNIFTSNLSNGCFAIGLRPSRIDLEDLVADRMIPLSEQTIFCPLDNLQDIYTVQMVDNRSPVHTLILLDNSNICRGIGNGLSLNLNNLPEGDYTLQALGYSGTLKIKIGDTIIKSSSVQYSTDCFVWSINTISIRLRIPHAGRINSATGDTLLFACPGDRLPDRITFNATSQSSSNYVVVITNEKNRIVAMTNLGGFVDFESFTPGSCRAYGLAYTGTLNIALDSAFTGVLSTDCYEVTPNFLIINKDVAKGGSINLKEGGTVYYSCPDKDGIRKIEFERRNSSMSPYQYVLTSESGSIIDFVQNDSLSFSNLNAQTYRIYGVAYSGRRVVSKLSNIFVSSFSDGCYSISENFIRVVHERARGGGVRLPDGSTKELFCPSETGNRLVQFRNVDVSGNLYNFIITDSTNRIIEISPRFSFNFDTVRRGLYFVYGVSYIGNITVKKGEVLERTRFSTECFSYSINRLEVIIGEIDGGRLTSSEGSDNVFTCPSNVDLDLIQIIPLQTRSLGYRYVITNEFNTIIGFSSIDMIDFGTAAINSKCRVYGVAYKGDFTGVLNRDVFQTAFSASCYDLSENFVSVRKLIPPNHRIISSLKDSVVTLCIGDSQKDTIVVATSDTIGFKTAFIGVESGKIVKVYTQRMIEFEKDSVGIMNLYSLMYTGRLLAAPGLNFLSGLAFSDDCFALSSNFYVIDKVKQGPFCIITKTKNEWWISDLKVYPNPVRDQSVYLTWTFAKPQTERFAQISISDIQGRLLFNLNHRIQFSNQVVLDPSSWPPGVLLLKIKVGDQYSTRKLVIYPK